MICFFINKFVTALSPANSKRSRLIVINNVMNVQGHFGLNLEKIRRSVQIVEI